MLFVDDYDFDLQSSKTQTTSDIKRKDEDSCYENSTNDYSASRKYHKFRFETMPNLKVKSKSFANLNSTRNSKTSINGKFNTFDKSKRVTNSTDDEDYALCSANESSDDCHTIVVS